MLRSSLCERQGSAEPSILPLPTSCRSKICILFFFPDSYYLRKMESHGVNVFTFASEEITRTTSTSAKTKLLQ